MSYFTKLLTETGKSFIGKFVRFESETMSIWLENVCEVENLQKINEEVEIYGKKSQKDFPEIINHRSELDNENGNSDRIYQNFFLKSYEKHLHFNHDFSPGYGTNELKQPISKHEINKSDRVLRRYEQSGSKNSPIRKPKCTVKERPNFSFTHGSYPTKIPKIELTREKNENPRPKNSFIKIDHEESFFPDTDPVHFPQRKSDLDIQIIPFMKFKLKDLGYLSIDSILIRVKDVEEDFSELRERYRTMKQQTGNVLNEIQDNSEKEVIIKQKTGQHNIHRKKTKKTPRSYAAFQQEAREFNAFEEVSSHTPHLNRFASEKNVYINDIFNDLDSDTKKYENHNRRKHKTTTTISLKPHDHPNDDFSNKTQYDSFQYDKIPFFSDLERSNDSFEDIYKQPHHGKFSSQHGTKLMNSVSNCNDSFHDVFKQVNLRTSKNEKSQKKSKGKSPKKASNKQMAGRLFTEMSTDPSEKTETNGKTSENILKNNTPENNNEDQFFDLF